MARNSWVAVVLAMLAGIRGEAAGAQTTPAPSAPSLADDGRRAFDFLFGKWKVKSRRLAARLQGATEWQEFEATNEARPLETGLGNQDVFRSTHIPGFVGMTFRFFDPKSRTWSLYWVDNQVGVLEPPVVGAFSGDAGVGIFKGPDVLRGRPIVVRFTWSGVTTGKPRWEQAFSPDGGQTWETNWTMEFTRMEEER